MLETRAIEGISSIWPEINSAFLSLKGSLQAYEPANKSQIIYKEILIGFDSITSCEIKDLYRFKIFLSKIHDINEYCMELENIHKALLAWVDFDYQEAETFLRRHILLYKGDVIAIFFLHMLQFCTGRTCELLEVLNDVEGQIPRDHYLISYFLSIKSFVLCENKMLDAALVAGSDAIIFLPDNIYGIHAVCHALHELGRWSDLISFLEENRHQWVNNVGMRMHVYWHLAIAYECSNQMSQALQSFRELYALKEEPFAKQDLDAVAFLWRLRLKSADAGFEAVWRRLAVLWTGAAGTSTSYFHKIHAAFAFAASHQSILIEKLIADSDGFGVEPAVHQAGIQALSSILHFANGDYIKCCDSLRSSQDYWPLFDGSYAQREILVLTLDFADRLKSFGSKLNIGEAA